MKFRITLKDPDGFGDGLDEAARLAVKEATGIDAEEREALEESKKEKISDFMKKWVEYSEYVELEFDTEANTCIVLPN